jgi:lipopolysaccharide biosynthesis glycosyltransferase
MNTKEFRKRYSCDYMLSLTQSTEYKFPDQDLLNSIAKDSVFIFPQEFNFLNTDWDISHAPKNLVEEYSKARENPKIIHYTTTKPWKLDLNPLHFHLFWKYCTRTPFIDAVIKNMRENKLIGQRAKDLFMKILKRKLKRER